MEHARLRKPSVSQGKDTLPGDRVFLAAAAKCLPPIPSTMSEAELHTLRERPNGGIRNKAARGELRRALPVGLVWGEEEGEIRFHPDEAVTGVVRTIFAKFTELGSARQVWLWFRSQNLSFPMHPRGVVPCLANCHPLEWIVPSYAAIYSVLSNPVYAGAYVYGKTRNERYVDEQGTVRKRIRHLPQEEWLVFLPGHDAEPLKRLPKDDLK
jgi:hypothetical protein